MNGWIEVLAAWLAFSGSHLLLSSRTLRPRLIGSLGERGFQGIYSLVALATFVWLIMAYAGAKHAGPLLWVAGPTLHGVSFVLSACLLTLTVAAAAQPKPTDMGSSAEPRARGFTRITRHPAFVLFGLVALSHTLVNGFLSDVVFFGGFAAWALVGGAHMDSRKRRQPELATYYGETSLLPFAAVAAGRTRLVWSEFSLARLAIGAAVTAAIWLAHPYIFGGNPRL